MEGKAVETLSLPQGGLLRSLPIKGSGYGYLTGPYRSAGTVGATGFDGTV